MHGAAILWAVLHEHVPATGQKVEDIFVGKQLEVRLVGNREQILAETEREQRGEPFSGASQTMMVAVANENYPLNPDDAVAMNERELFTLARGKFPNGIRDDSIYVPRIPHDAAEADAMLQMMTITLDATNPVAIVRPEDAIRTYAGYTDEELRRGKPSVSVS